MSLKNGFRIFFPQTGRGISLDFACVVSTPTNLAKFCLRVIGNTRYKDYNFGQFYLNIVPNHCKNGNPSFHGILYPAGKNHIISFSFEAFLSFFGEMEKSVISVLSCSRNDSFI